MTAIEIRRMRESELEPVVAIWERARWDAQPWLEERMGYGHVDNLAHFREVVMREHEVWVAVLVGEITGLLAVSDGFVDKLYVDPRHQRRGIGSALLAHAKALFPDGLSLYTHQRNERARAFYEARGFRTEAFGVSPPPESEPDVRYGWDPGS